MFPHREGPSLSGEVSVIAYSRSRTSIRKKPPVAPQTGTRRACKAIGHKDADVCHQEGVRLLNEGAGKPSTQAGGEKDELCIFKISFSG